MNLDIAIIIVLVLLIFGFMFYYKYINQVYENYNSYYRNDNLDLFMKKDEILRDYGPTYYKYPEEMSYDQQIQFLQKANYENMTLGDYINFLQLKGKKYKMSETENVIINKLKRGEIISLNDIPIPTYINKCHIPTSSEYYYMNTNMRI